MEHLVIQRIKQEKSLVDATLVSKACQEYYQNQADSFVICSSDSDFWVLVQSLSTASFLFMVQRDRFSDSMKKALAGSGIHYAYIEDFYEGNSHWFQTDALLREVGRTLEQAVRLNLMDIMKRALEKTQLSLSERELAQFFQQYLKTLRLVVEDNGSIRLALNIK